MSGDNYYLDTSVILPYYRQEAKSSAIQNLLISLAPPLMISSLTKVEFASALARWVRMYELTDSQADLIQATFDQDIQSGLFSVTAVEASQYNLAEKWISKRATSIIRTLDAIHLACSHSLGATMITSDTILAHAADILGLQTRLV
jgi:predicted nucleic acid-binding protein